MAGDRDLGLAGLMELHLLKRSALPGHIDSLSAACLRVLFTTNRLSWYVLDKGTEL